ncbi:MAG: hypothetical protein ACI9B9_002307, partial [Halioglobus sp.]
VGKIVTIEVINFFGRALRLYQAASPWRRK